VVAPAWAPTAADVCAIVPQRTGALDGRASGAFSSTTVPTDTQVTGEIAQAVFEVETVVGPTPDAQIAPMATRATALLVASYVELSFYPDSNMTAQGPAAQLYQRYKDLMAMIQKAQSGSGDIAGPPSPVGYFPAAVENGYGTSVFENT